MVKFIDIDDSNEMIFYSKCHIRELEIKKREALGDLERIEIDRAIEAEIKELKRLEEKREKQNV